MSEPAAQLPDVVVEPDMALAVRDFERLLKSPWLPPDKRPTPQQARFLLCRVVEALYGGAVGGGKSVALLMAAAMYADVPGYAALLLRKSFRDLDQAEALIPVSKEWWTGKADWNEQKHRWTFPSGATIAFGYLEHKNDVYQYQGSAYQFVGFDELTQFEEFYYTYLFSRMRKRVSGEIAQVPTRMRASAMPGGGGHQWVRKRFLAEKNADRVFVRATMDDNPHLDRDDYLRMLAQVDPIARQQMVEGDWDAYEGGRFFREWFAGKVWRFGRGRYHVAGGEPAGWLAEQCPTFVVGDLAASEKRSADYTVFGSFAVTPENDLLVLDVVREHFAVEKIVPELLLFCGRQRVRPSWVGLEADGFQVAIARQAMRTRGMPAVRELRTEGKGKLVRATPAINRAHAGQIFFPADPTPWLEDCMSELLQFSGDEARDAHDDVVDVVAWAAIEMSHASFTPPESGPGPGEGLPRLDPHAQRGFNMASRLNPFLQRRRGGANPYGRW